MATYTMTTAGPILKEEFDSRIGLAISKRNTFYSWFRGRASKDDTSTREAITLRSKRSVIRVTALSHRLRKPV